MPRIEVPPPSARNCHVCRDHGSARDTLAIVPATSQTETGSVSSRAASPALDRLATSKLRSELQWGVPPLKVLWRSADAEDYAHSLKAPLGGAPDPAEAIAKPPSPTSPSPPTIPEVVNYNSAIAVRTALERQARSDAALKAHAEEAAAAVEAAELKAALDAGETVKAKGSRFAVGRKGSSEVAQDADQRPSFGVRRMYMARPQPSGTSVAEFVAMGWRKDPQRPDAWKQPPMGWYRWKMIINLVATAAIGEFWSEVGRAARAQARAATPVKGVAAVTSTPTRSPGNGGGIGGGIVRAVSTASATAHASGARVAVAPSSKPAEAPLTRDRPRSASPHRAGKTPPSPYKMGPSSELVHRLEGVVWALEKLATQQKEQMRGLHAQVASLEAQLKAATAGEARHQSEKALMAAALDEAEEWAGRMRKKLKLLQAEAAKKQPMTSGKKPSKDWGEKGSWQQNEEVQRAKLEAQRAKAAADKAKEKAELKKLKEQKGVFPPPPPAAPEIMPDRTEKGVDKGHETLTSQASKDALALNAASELAHPESPDAPPDSGTSKTVPTRGKERAAAAAASEPTPLPAASAVGGASAPAAGAIPPLPVNVALKEESDAFEKRWGDHVKTSARDRRKAKEAAQAQQSGVAPRAGR